MYTYDHINRKEVIIVTDMIRYISVNLWPSYNNGMTEVNVEYELEQEELCLNDVNIIIPIP